MFLDGEKSIEAGLDGDERGQWFVNTPRLRAIAGLQGAPQPNQCANQVRTWHGAGHAVLVRFNERDAAGALEDTRAPIRSIEQLDQAWNDGAGLRLEHHALRPELVEQLRLHRNAHRSADITAR